VTFRHYLAMLGVLLIPCSLSAPLLADDWWPVFWMFVSGGVVCIGAAAIVTPDRERG
jgi:hypothetical protein